MTDIGAPYIKFALVYDKFLRKTKMTPTDVWKSVSEEWRRHGQKPYSRQLFYMARYGLRALPGDVCLFLNDRHGAGITFDDLYTTHNLDNEPVKKNGVRLPRQKELFNAR